MASARWAKAMVARIAAKLAVDCIKFRRIIVSCVKLMG
jgi:hypothetical protein